MKNYFKYLLVLFTMLAFSFNYNVKADTYTEQFNDTYMWLSNAFVAKEDASGHKDYQQLTMITRRSDNQFVYCMEVDAALYPSQTYTGQDFNQAETANITPEQWERIQLLAYYGYGYSDSTVDHSDVIWYAITQVMIWNTIPHGINTYFTDELVGQPTTKYDDKMAEMEKLIAEHNVVPDFGGNSFTLSVGTPLKLTDTNEVLDKYEVSINDYVLAVKNKNELILSALNIGNTTITLTKKDVKYSHPAIVYVKDGTQDVFQVGSYTPVEEVININIPGGKIAIQKVDSDTGKSSPQGLASLKGAVYGIYKEDGTYITQIVTDENGYAQSDYLPDAGKYYLQEITPSEGYELDKQKYYFDIKMQMLYPSVTVKEKVIEREFIITKVANTNKTEIMTPEVGVKFGIYDTNNKLIKTLTTDNEGIITFTLPYGKYILRQLTAPSGFEKMKDYEFEIKESGPTINKIFGNSQITARVKVIKVDQDGKVIAKEGIKFKIKNLSTGNYVCQTTSYPNNKTYCEFTTDKNGMLITPYPLTSGDYELEEVDQIIEGYTWNSKPLKFFINENANIQSMDGFDAVIEIKFTNEEVKGQIKIQKVGEKLVIKDGKFTYVEIPLPSVTFGLYDADKKLIGTYVTDEDGYINIENLKLGKYILKELKTSDNYILDPKEYVIELKYKDQYTAVVTQTFTLKNYLEKGSLEFTKKDLATGQEIPDVKIEIYTENDELIYSGITDKNGKIIINDLFIGKFYIIETEPATGYKLNKDKVFFEIKEDGQIVKAEMKNEKIEMPETYNTDLISLISASSITLLGTGLLIYAKKQKEK